MGAGDGRSDATKGDGAEEGSPAPTGAQATRHAIPTRKASAGGRHRPVRDDVPRPISGAPPARPDGDVPTGDARCDREEDGEAATAAIPVVVVAAGVARSEVSGGCRTERRPGSSAVLSIVCAAIARFAVFGGLPPRVQDRQHAVLHGHVCLVR